MLFRKSAPSTRSRANAPTHDITLRDIARSDVPRIAVLAGDWDVASMTGRIPYPYSESAALQWVEDLAPGEIVHAITCDTEFVGVCGMMPNDDDEKSAEVGYWVGKPYWGRGLATSAVRQLVKLAFKANKFEHLTSGHFTDNPASGRVLEKLGFTPTGMTDCWCEARARNIDALRYELDAPRGWWRRR